MISDPIPAGSPMVRPKTGFFILNISVFNYYFLHLDDIKEYFNINVKIKATVKCISGLII